MDIKSLMVTPTKASETFSIPGPPEVDEKTEATKRVVQTECSVDGCENPFRARGLCVTHYNHWRAEQGNLKKCSVSDCENAAHSEGYCPSHLFAFKKYGDPMKRNSIEDVSQTCTFVDDKTGLCGEITTGRDLCNNHYMKMYRLNRKANKTDGDNSLLARFWKAPTTNRSNRSGK